MNRRNFLKGFALLAGAVALSPLGIFAKDYPLTGKLIPIASAFGEGMSSKEYAMHCARVIWSRSVPGAIEAKLDQIILNGDVVTTEDATFFRVVHRPGSDKQIHHLYPLLT